MTSVESRQCAGEKESYFIGVIFALQLTDAMSREAK